MGHGLFWVNFNSLVPLQFPDQMAKVYSISQTFNGIGRMIGPLVGAVLFYTVGYVLMFIIIGFGILIGIPFIYVPFKRMEKKLDFLKSISDEKQA